jgi:hypothetical protein
LYKFGHIYVHNVVPFEGKLSDHADDKFLFDAVTAYMDTYEYSTEYLLLHIFKIPFSGSSVEIIVKDIVDVYALDEEARASLAVSLDSRIVLQVSAWKDFFSELNKKQAIRQSKAGEFNCFEIFKISNEDRAAVAKLLPKGFVEELFSDLFSHVRPSGNRSIWNYLIRYERHHPYWNDNRGYFSDAIHVYENFKQKSEIDYEIADEVPLGDVIGSCGTKFSEIYKLLKHKQGNDYQVNGCNYFAVAPLFLYLKFCFKEGGITPASFYSNEYLYNGDFYKYFGFDFAVAVSLLGLSLGHDLTYSCYYEIQNLGIFNHFVESRINAQILNPETGDSLNSQEAQDLINKLSNEVKRLREDTIAMEELLNEASNEKWNEEKKSTSATKDSGTENESLKETPVIEGEEKVQTELVQDKKREQVQPLTEEKNPIVNDEEQSKQGEHQDSIQEEIVQEEVVQEQPSNEGQILSSSMNYPILMKKLTKKGDKFCTGRFAKEKYAHDEKEYQKLLNQNYAPEDYLRNSSLFANYND